jgi:hypothetical protein
MPYTEYDTMPFKVFFKILRDIDSIHLLGIENKEEALKVWERIKEEWNEKHPSPDSKRLLDAYKKVLYESVKANQQITIINFLNGYDGDHKHFFEKYGFKWIEEEDKRIDYLLNQASKHKQKCELYEAQLLKLQKEAEDNQESEVENSDNTLAVLNKSIASLEMHGFTIENYENLTCGKYDAITEVIKEKARQNGK